MKRILLIVFVGLIGILGNWGSKAYGQNNDCADTVFWGMDLNFDADECCWTVPAGSNWEGQYVQYVSDFDTTTDHRLLSPWIEIPATAAIDSLVVSYSTTVVCKADLSVCITTDGVNYDTLRRVLIEEWADGRDTIYLGDYAGQMVRIEFCRYGLNSSYNYINDSCQHSVDWNLIVGWISLFELNPPQAWATVAERSYVGEPVVWQAGLTLGSHTGLTYTWHSTLTGQTMTGDSVTMTYTAAGMDTVMMVASNAYGNDTVVYTVLVFDCQGVIIAHPWIENFETDYDCWRSIGAGRWNKSGNSILAAGDGDKIFTSPAVVLPADSTGLRLYWKAKNYAYSGSVTYQVLVTTTNRFDIVSYDTIFTSTQGTSQTQRSVSLAEYAGDTVYIAFRQKDQNYRNIQISDVRMYNAVVPMGTLEAPTYTVATGDTVHYIMHLTQGDSVNYSWYSSLLDSTIVTVDSVLTIVYPIPGSETLTATVSNTYGTLVLEKSLGVFSCDTISLFPWSEDFVETGSDASYNACWEMSGYYRLADNYSYGYDEEDGSPSAGSSRHDFMKSTTQWDYMLTPPIAVPTVLEKNLSLWVEHFSSLMAVVETEEGVSDTVYSLDNRMMTMIRRPLSLAPYAGQTIRVRLLNNSNYSYNHESVVDRIRVDYDTVPVVVLLSQQQTTTDSATLIVASQLRGFVPGLSYSWQSQVGGTFTTNAAGDSAWVTYSAGITGFNDTVSVTATNSYCSYTTRRAISIVDCLPVDSLPWVETFTEGMPCWYKPAGSNWQAATYYGYDPKYIISNSGSDTVAHWVMSKAITLPADTSLCTRLFWDVAGSNNTVHHNYGVWVTTSEDYTDTLNYTLLYLDTNTHTNFRTFDHMSASLAAYAGQTIHVAFRNIRQQSNLYIDNVTIRTTAEPVASIVAPAEVFTIDPVDTAVAVLNEGSSAGLTYAWLSTMLGNGTGNSFPLNYTTGGTDTLTLVVTNAYGSDTATTFITVRNCPAISTLPHEEGFNTGADLSCWRNWNFGPNNYTPYTWHLTSQASHQAMGSDGSGSLSYFNSWLVTPAITLPENADGLNLDLDVYGSSTSSGGRSYISYMDILVSTTGATNTSHFTDTLSRDYYLSRWEHVHLPLSAYAGQTINIAFVNNTKNDVLLRNKGVWIDDLSIGYTYLPDANFTYTTAMMGDTVSYTATTGNCVSDSLSYTWHSTLMDSTFSGETISFVYDTAGNDTIELIVSNAYGADTVSKTVSVGSYPLPQVSLPNLGSLIAFDTTYVIASVNGCSQRDIVHTWHSSMVAAGQAQMVVDANNAILYYTSEGVDTITYTVSNYYGVDSATAIYTVYNCNGVSIPWNEDFSTTYATTYNSTAGTLPTCWNYQWNGTASYKPHVVGSGSYHYSPDNSNSLIMFAGTGSCDSVAYVTLPAVGDTLNHLTFSLWYAHESANFGTLTLGYMNDTLFVPLATLPPVGTSGRRDTISLSSLPVTASRLAFRWYNTTSWYTVHIDDLALFSDDAIYGPANVEANSIGAGCVTLTWTAVEGATAYHVTIEGEVDTVVSGTTATFCGFTSNTTYTASVAGIVGTDIGRYTTVTFTTPCSIFSLPWYEDFEGNNPLACWSYKGVVYYTGILVCTESYWDDYCHSGSRGLQMYNYAEDSSIVVSSPIIEAPANNLLVSFWVSDADEYNTGGGLLEAGIITDPTDTSTFVPLIQCSMTGTPTRYEFDTRDVTVSGPVALAFRTSIYSYAIVIDDISVEQISACARVRSVSSYALDARSAVVEWQYDSASAIPNTGALITLTDITDNSIAPIVVNASGNSYTFNGLSLGHRYIASVQALCANDTASFLTTEVVPTGNPCAEVTGPYSSNWFLMNCDRPYSYSQSFYPAVLAASVDTLFGIAYYLTSSEVEPYPSSYNTYSNGPRLVDVYIGQTTDSVFSAPVSASNLTLAVQNYELQVTDTGWVHINFITPVPLDGVSNLIVTLDDNTGAIYGDVEFSHHTADFGTCFRTSTASYSYTQTYDPYNPAGFNTYTGTQIPDIQLLGGCSNGRCLQPIATVTDQDEHSITLEWYQRGSETQWQVEYHVDGDSTWITAGTTSNTSNTVSGLNASTGYRLRVASLCSGETIYSDVVAAHTQCGVVSLPYHQTFRNYDMPNYQSSISEGGIPCWQTGNITLLSQGRGLWNTHQNGDYIISPMIGVDLGLVMVTLTASGSTFFHAGIKVGVCDSIGNNLVWIDTITLSDNAQAYAVHLDHYTGNDHYLAIGGSYESWTLYDVLFEMVSYTLTLAVNDTTMGTVSGGGTYMYGADVVITATPNTGYHFVEWNDGVTEAVRTIEVKGNTTYTAFFAADTNNGIDDSQLSTLNSQLSLFPNPATDMVRVESGMWKVERVEVIDMTGRRHKELVVGQTSFDLDVADLPRGVYFLRLTGIGWTDTRKIILR